MIAFDHVIVITADLDSAAESFLANHGLASVPGGRHAGHGTGNRIIPLGNDYLELMAVIDPAEASASPLGRWVAAIASTGGGPAALCLRVADADVHAERLGIEPLGMSREKPDGTVLQWRLVGLDEALGADRLPFLIDWDIDPADHPSRAPVDHRVTVSGISWVEIGGDPRLAAVRIGSDHLDIRAVGGPPGLRRVAIGGSTTEIVLEPPR